MVNKSDLGVLVLTSDRYVSDKQKPLSIEESLKNFPFD